jgi:ABC-type glycerol-3-phosphate transport system substrate-binding protein
MMLFVLVLMLSLPMSVMAQAAEPTPIVADLGSGETHVSFWNGLTGSDGVTMNAMLEAFVVDHPEFTVTTEIIPWNTLYAKLQTAFVAGTPPDVFLLHSAEIAQFASYGVLKDLGPWYESGGGWFPDDDVSSVTRDGMAYEGVTYGIPLDNHGRGLWINNDMFEAAGISTDPATHPTTYEGWVELFQQLTLDANGNNAASADFDPENVVQWGYSVQEWPNKNFLSALYQLGGQFVSDDGSTIMVNSEEGIQALQQSVDLVFKYHVSPPPAGFDTWQSFSGGTVAVIPTGTWFRNFAVEQTEINSQAWPQFQFGPEPATYLGIHTFMVPVGAEGAQLEAVQTLIQWVADHEVDWAGSGQVPARLSAQAALDPVNYPSNILLGQTMSEYGFLDYAHVAIQEMYAALDPELSEALNGLKTPEQALNDAAERMQQVLDRNA